ncbi:MAG TPA: winged helix-turn-helix domain-containing protein [Ktedonobacteraceae bacterium]|nr:winged helix-turn-helix domain-containing protein [Ktedonobacteraceae bacterium]
MFVDINITETAALLADSTRVTILMTLSDGRALPAGELARCAHVSPSTAAAHLNKLVESQWLCVERQGRHRYFRLADPLIVHVLEELATISQPQPANSFREVRTGSALQLARTCYDHMAGMLGVRLAQALVVRGYLVEQNEHYGVTEPGKEYLRTLGIEYEDLEKRRRQLAPQCLDWSERRHHIAGSLGAALTERFFAFGWIMRVPSSRIVQVTETGKKYLAEAMDIVL